VEQKGSESCPDRKQRRQKDLWMSQILCQRGLREGTLTGHLFQKNEEAGTVPEKPKSLLYHMKLWGCNSLRKNQKATRQRIGERHVRFILSLEEKFFTGRTLVVTDFQSEDRGGRAGRAEV